MVLLPTDPLTAITPEKVVTLSWNPLNTLTVDTVKICFGPVVGGGDSNNYTFRISHRFDSVHSATRSIYLDNPFRDTIITEYDTTSSPAVAGWFRVTRASAAVSFTFKFVPAFQRNTAAQPSMMAGRFYFYVQSKRIPPPAKSNEAFLVVESRQSALLSAPKGEIAESAPVFNWQPVPGVPYYHLLLSDQQIKVDNGISGASFIWQVITNKTSIQYGEPDPSGLFPEPPPLAAGVENYFWLVLNNYGNQKEFTSVAAIPSAEVFHLKPSLEPKLRNIPASSLNLYNDSTHVRVTDSTNAGNLRFTWARADSTDSVNIHKLYVYLKMVDSTTGMNAMISVWNKAVSGRDNSLVMPARDVLLQNRYVWKVFAENQAGAGVVSDTAGFNYRISTGAFKIYTREIVSNGAVHDTVAVPVVNVAVQALSGSINNIPVVTTNSGFSEKILPGGTYRFTTSKAGYSPVSAVDSVLNGATRTVALYLVRSAAEIFGRVLSQSDTTGINLALVQAVSSRGDTVRSPADNYGSYRLSLTAGAWNLTATEPSYQTSLTHAVSVADGEQKGPDTIFLAPNTLTLSGLITNDNGAPLSQVQVTMGRSGIPLDTVYSGSPGNYSFSVEQGVYDLAFSKSGFASAQRTGIVVISSTPVNVSLTSGAALVTGQVLGQGASGTALIPGATLVLATDRNFQNIAANVQTNSFGEFNASVPPSSRYFVRAAKPGYQTADDSTPVLAALQTAVLSLTLERFTGISGTVDSSGQALGAASLTLLDSATRQIRKTAVSGPDGSFEIRDVTDGHYQVLAGKAGCSMDSAFVTVTNNVAAPAGVACSLSAGSRNVFWPAPVPAQIRVNAPLNATLARTDTLKNIGAGTYYISADADSVPLIDLKYHRTPVTGPGTTVDSLRFSFIHRLVADSLDAGNTATFTVLNSRRLTVGASLLYFRNNQAARWDSLSLTGGLDSLQAALPADTAGDNIFFEYYFVIRQGTDLFSNVDDPFRVFIRPATSLKYLELIPNSAGGSPVILPKQTAIAFKAVGINGGFHALDTADLRFRWERNGLVVCSTSTYLFPASNGATLQPETLAVTVSQGAITRQGQLAYQVADASVHKLVITGSNDEISSTGAASFTAQGLDTVTNTALYIPVSWSADPFPADTAAFGRNGTYQPPARNWVGLVSVAAKASLGSRILETSFHGTALNPADRGLKIFYRLRGRGDAALVDTVQDGRALTLWLPGNIIPAGTVADIRASIPSLSTQEAGTTDQLITGSAYNLTSSQDLANPVTVIIKVSKAAEKAENRLATWVEDSIKWSPLADSTVTYFDPDFAATANKTSAAYVGGRVNHFSLYGILTTAQALGIYGLEVSPNPFSPYIVASDGAGAGSMSWQGLRIAFTPSTNANHYVTIRLRIYNMAGRLVKSRSFEDVRGQQRLSVASGDRYKPRTPVAFRWDGTTDGGALANNGRYVLVISVDDGTKTIYDKKVIGLFK
jgi:hypothetical protein